MPTYAYACSSCGHRFDIYQSFTDDTLTECPECGGVLRKEFGNVGVVFKGSGFYRNDARGKPSSESGSPSSDSSSSASKDSAASTSSSTSSTTKDSSGSSSSSTSSTSSAPSKPAQSSNSPSKAG